MGMVAPGVVTDRLSWVTSSISNVGLDFDLWNGKLSGTIEWFNRKNEGILADRAQSAPDTFGASFLKENLNSNRTGVLRLNWDTEDKSVRTSHIQ